MLERVPITLRSARRHSAVHPAAAVRHRWRLARLPAPCPRSASRAEVHGQFALHGVDPLISLRSPPPGGLDHADDRLPARMDVDVLDRDLLLALAAVAVERFEQRGIGAGELVGLGEVLAPALEGLFADHGAAIAFHRSVVGGDQLRRHHAFELVLRPDAN